MTRRPCWRSIQNNFFLKNLHENRVTRGEKCFFSSPPTWPPCLSRASNRGGAASSTLYSLSSWTEGNFYAHASIRSAEVKIGPFAYDTSPKRIGKARYPPLSTVPPPNLNTHVPAGPPSYSFIPFAQQQGFDWFRLQSEEFQLAQQQSFVLFEEFPFLLRNNVLIGAKCTLVCFLIIALQMHRFFTLKSSLLSFSQSRIFFFILAHCSSLAYFRP